MKRTIFLLGVTGFVMLAATVALGAVVPTRAALNSILGGGATTETFESFAMSNGGATAISSPLDSTSIISGQGPGLVVNGIRLYTGAASLQWNGASYYGQPSKDVLADNNPLRIDFTTPVNAFGLDLLVFSGYPDNASLTIYGTDNTTVLGSFSGIALATPSAPVFFGYENSAGIGRVALTESNWPWSPIIDNLTFGNQAATAVPEPATCAIWALLIGLGLTFGWLRKRKTTQQ